MPKIQIITDSGCDLPSDLLAQYNIHVLPITVHFADQLYRDGVDLSAEEFYQRLKTAQVPPNTSQINPDQYLKAYQQYDQETQLLVIGLSSKLTGSLQSAELAKRLLQRDAVYIFDSKSASLGLGLCVLKAAEYVAEGLSIEQVITRLKVYQQQAYGLFVLDSLKHLLRTGRLSKPEAALGSMLNIKPILWFAPTGEVLVKEKVRSFTKALSTIIERFKEAEIDFANATLAIAHANCLSIAEDYAAEVERELKPKRIIVNIAGSAIGTHVGQGGIGLFH